MIAQQVPRRLRKAIEWVKADPARAWTVREIAAAWTLQRQFRRYMGQMLMAFVRDLRLNHARVEMLRSCGAESVTEIACTLRLHPSRPLRGVVPDAVW